MTDELLNERYALAIERIRQIPAEKSVPQPYRDFFAQMAQYLCKMDQIRSRIAEGYLKTASEEELAVFNREPYEDVIGEWYETSYGNPAFAVRALGETHGRSLCCLYRELGNAVVWVYEDRLLELTAAMELYLELYAMFEEETLPSAQYVKESIYWYVSDYAEERQEYQVREIVDPSLHFVKDIVMESDLTDLRYLYQYGEYITENEKGTARFLNTFSQEEIDAMARTYTEGFRKCFLVARKDLSKKKTVSIRFHIGFERMIRAAILQFREMGLEPVISRGARRTWVAGASANKQYDYDHRNDEALYLNEDLVKRRLRAMQVKYDEYKELAGGYAGPAVVETFGEVPFEPVNKKQALHLNERQQKLRVGFQNEAGQIVNRYIKDDEYGYTIIAYPMPEIDPRYEKIFREIVKINTLDYEKYQRIQQYLIDALDEGVSVQVLGKGENRTDLRVMLHHLNDPAKETNFENCVADCNIPVGEVFTSPSLTGTTGVLHVTGVYLNEAGQIVNRYIKDDEYGYTIIAYPMPEIDPRYEKIFREIVKINTLDYEKYQRIQQYLIDALDEGVSVQVLGKGENRTDLRVMLHHLNDPAKETNFENCVADCNIPVGEVFTSPSLTGTTGVLHVTGVYLNELYYRDLCLTLTDGMITAYDCANFEKEEDNRTYIEENLLYHHRTLPIGEFAIGTNTTAYVMAEQYGIAGKLPILIAEKMGPHFAMGDTCYAWAEDSPMYNPDGKEVIARENEVSAKRKEDPLKAYFGCHTDITIPYRELQSVAVEKADGTTIPLIEDGRFVLPGTEELNEPFG